ncbi:uncharacterized protein ASPGLDRAFT_1473561 [Aspergillus glaucus CBS 516.65]|uniref:EF-hand domain-containing protein n=1 Tax=Aspergillus glaucus CBS 516.65 TaxID=1160497 RepID=A0A1L9VLJ4_ASPGL|nr:hypothetical protein ASPGLDRAFT_1473561 [Aspergillus glaucus CBS 516.65]OJJ84796.1 hypothetical protein ASPGLDRAFT_1473561 [Aspergillus glaucus CBS 516.65]
MYWTQAPGRDRDTIFSNSKRVTTAVCRHPRSYPHYKVLMASEVEFNDDNDGDDRLTCGEVLNICEIMMDHFKGYKIHADFAHMNAPVMILSCWRLNMSGSSWLIMMALIWLSIRVSCLI